MGFKSGAQGINQKGKTKGTNLGDDGAKVGIDSGKGSKGATTVKSIDMKKYGRNVARAMNQKKGR
jgi:hypothetical protein